MLPDRRNALTPAMERTKKSEFTKHDKFVAVSVPNQVYIWYYVVDDEVRVCYVGKAIDPTQRFSEHRAAIKLGADVTRKYENARHLKHELEMVVIDAEGERSENDWKAEFTEKGHALWNEVEGIETKRHKVKRTDLPSINQSSAPLTPCKTYFDLVEGAKQLGNDWASAFYKIKPTAIHATDGTTVDAIQ